LGEANRAAGELVPTVQATPYLLLLQRMQNTFEKFDYADRLARNLTLAKFESK
jgi:hypothetical protein